MLRKTTAHGNLRLRPQAFTSDVPVFLINHRCKLSVKRYAPINGPGDITDGIARSCKERQRAY